MQGHTNRWFMRHRRKLFHYRHRTIFKAFCINWQMECTINIMRLIGEKSWPLLPSHFYPKSSGAENCIFLLKWKENGVPIFIVFWGLKWAQNLRADPDEKCFKGRKWMRSSIFSFHFYFRGFSWRFSLDSLVSQMVRTIGNTVDCLLIQRQTPN